MNDIDIQIVKYNSELQKKSIELRYKVLREPLGLVYAPEQLDDEMDEIHIVAVKNEQVLGVVVLKRAGAGILKMRQVAIEPSLQRMGIGKMMVLFSEQYAIEHDFNTIELHARETAVDFYLCLNYEVVSDQFTEVGIPHYIMKKTFTSQASKTNSD